MKSGLPQITQITQINKKKRELLDDKSLVLKGGCAEVDKQAEMKF
jgi:hypothetical protein